MNHISLSLTLDDDGTAEFGITLVYNEFSGKGACFVDVKEFRKIASQLSVLPLPSKGTMPIEGGYYSEDMQSFAQKHLEISAHPRRSASHATLKIMLSSPFVEDVDEFRATLVCEIPVSYELLRKMSNAMDSLSHGHSEVFTFDIE